MKMITMSMTLYDRYLSELKCNLQTAQCIGRTIRNKMDYSFVVLADNRFSFTDNQNKLPEWIRRVREDWFYDWQRLLPEHNKLSVSMAATTAKVFYKEMAQDKVELKPRLLTRDNLLQYILTRDIYRVYSHKQKMIHWNHKLHSAKRSYLSFYSPSSSSSVNSSRSTSSLTRCRFVGFISSLLDTSSSNNTSFSNISSASRDIGLVGYPSTFKQVPFIHTWPNIHILLQNRLLLLISFTNPYLNSHPNWCDQKERNFVTLSCIQHHTDMMVILVQPIVFQ